MKGKPIDLNATVYELCKKYPELVSILVELGFSEITKPGMLNSAGRFMTLPRGASFRHIPLETIITTLETNGFDASGQNIPMEEII